MSTTEETEPVYCSEGVQILRAPEFAEGGRQQRTVTDPSRFGELDDLYASLGFETTTTGLDPSRFGDACTTCAVTACAVYVALLTREAASASG